MSFGEDPDGPEEPGYDDAPESWRPAVYCPQCQGTQTRFVTLNYEVSVYQCEDCGCRFEIEEEA